MFPSTDQERESSKQCIIGHSDQIYLFLNLLAFAGEHEYTAYDRFRVNGPHWKISIK